MSHFTLRGTLYLDFSKLKGKDSRLHWVNTAYIAVWRDKRPGVCEVTMSDASLVELNISAAAFAKVLQDMGEKH